MSLSFNPLSIAQPNSPHFGGVYRLMSNEYGIPHDLDIPGNDHDIPERLGQYLHPGTLVYDHDSVWKSFSPPKEHFTLFFDGPELKEVNQYQELTEKQFQLETNPIHQKYLKHSIGNKVDEMGMRETTKPLDITAIQQNRLAFPIDPSPNVPAPTTSSLSPMVQSTPIASFSSNPSAVPLVNRPMTAPTSLTTESPNVTASPIATAPSPLGTTNPMAALAPPVGLDTNAVTVLSTVPMPMALPGPTPMAYQLHPPGPLDAATLGAASISNSAAAAAAQ